MPPFRPPFRNSRRPSVGGITTSSQVSAVSPNSDRLAGGTSITITGVNFRNNVNGTAPQVLFGAAVATSVVVVNATTITCLSPVVANAGLVNVSVTIGTETGTLLGAFAYVVPVLVDVTPGFGPFGGGTSVILEGYNFVTGSTITFGGVPATGVSFLDSNHYACVTPNHAVGFADVTITEPGGGGASITLRNGYQFTLLTRGADIRRNPGIVIRDLLNTQPNTCSFVIDGTAPAPQVGEKIEIVDDMDSNRQLFVGTIVSFLQIYEGQTNQLAWQVTAADGAFLLNKYYPFGVYKNVSASDIVKDLIKRFAPGFTTNHVQTSLAKLTVTFDGTRNLTTCLGDLAHAIGGGRWRVDYTNDIHFFHVIPPNFTAPSLPQQGMNVGPGTSMVVAEGAPIGTTFSYVSGFYLFCSTFVYDNGMESTPSPLSNCVTLSGSNQIAFSSIPLGASAGGHACVKRRIYFRLNGGPLGRYIEIGDNTTTAFTHNPSILPAGVFSQITTPLPGVPYVAPPAGPTFAPVAQQSAALDTYPPPPFAGGQASSFTPGTYSFKVSNIYRNGVESLPSPASGYVTLDGTHAIDLLNIPAGATIGGFDVVARRVWMNLHQAQGATRVLTDWAPDNTGQSYFIPDNSTVSMTTYTGLSNGDKPRTNPAAQDQPAWPNADGPSLETDTLPDDINASNTSVLRDPQFTSAVDMSQVRNRVKVYGAGSTLTEVASAGATVLKVADTSVYNQTGGTLYALGYVLTYLGINASTGAGQIFLTADSALPQDLPDGTPVLNFLTLEHLESQKALSKIELDANGNPTDGVHEYPIVDNSLVTPFQMYQRASAELEMFAWPIVTINYATRDPNTRAGKMVHVNLTDPPCVGDFLIQSVTIDQIHDESDDLMPRYNVRASSVKFDLNDLLLMIMKATQPKQSSTIVAAASGGGGDSAGIQGVVQTAEIQAVTQAQAVIGTATSNVMYQVELLVTVAQLNNSFTSPILVIAGVAGKVIVPVFWSFEQNIGANTFGSAPTFILAYKSGASYLPSNNTGLLTGIALTNGSNRYQWSCGSNTMQTILVNVLPTGLPVYFKSNGDNTAGSGTFVISVVYYLKSQSV